MALGNDFFQVRFIKQIGGQTLSDCVKRAWESVLTLEVRAMVNWNGKLRTGQPQKFGLKKAKVTEAFFSKISDIVIYLFSSPRIARLVFFLYSSVCVSVSVL